MFLDWVGNVIETVAAIDSILISACSGGLKGRGGVLSHRGSRKSVGTSGTVPLCSASDQTWSLSLGNWVPTLGGSGDQALFCVLHWRIQTRHISSPTYSSSSRVLAEFTAKWQVFTVGESMPLHASRRASVKMAVTRIKSQVIFVIPWDFKEYCFLLLRSLFFDKENGLFWPTSG